MAILKILTTTTNDFSMPKDSEERPRSRDDDYEEEEYEDTRSKATIAHVANDGGTDSHIHRT